MDSNHLWTALRYVELNPVRAGLVGRPEEYPWSSACAHFGAAPDGVTDLQEWATRWTAREWREFTTTLSQEDDAIRESTHRGRPLGSVEFVGRLESQLKRRLLPAKGGRPKRPTKTAAAFETDRVKTANGSIVLALSGQTISS
jgi:putative transposase